MDGRGVQGTAFLKWEQHMQKRVEGMSESALEKEKANKNGVRRWWRGCRSGRMAERQQRPHLTNLEAMARIEEVPTRD